MVLAPSITEVTPLEEVPAKKPVPVTEIVVVALFTLVVTERAETVGGGVVRIYLSAPTTAVVPPAAVTLIS